MAAGDLGYLLEMTSFTATEIDGDGQATPVLAVDPWADQEPEPERGDNSLDLLRWLAEGRTPRHRSRRLEIALHLAKVHGSPKTVRELAATLGIAKSQTGQIVAELRAKLGFRP